MNPEIKQKWVHALRSGEYRQGTQYLKRDWESETRFCCLGVLCELAKAEGVIEERVPPHGIHEFGPEVNGLPVEVREWAGIESRLGYFELGSQGTSLSDLNDQGVLFDIIAGIIEEKF